MPWLQLPPGIWSQAVYAWLPITLTHWRFVVQKEKCMASHISICTWILLMSKRMFKSEEDPQKCWPLHPCNYVWNEGKPNSHKRIWGLSCWHLYVAIFLLKNHLSKIHSTLRKTELIRKCNSSGLCQHSTCSTVQLLMLAVVEAKGR